MEQKHKTKRKNAANKSKRETKTVAKKPTRRKTRRKKVEEWSSEDDFFTDENDTSVKDIRKVRKCKENTEEKSVLEKLSTKLEKEDQQNSRFSEDSDWSDADPDWFFTQIGEEENSEKSSKKKAKEWKGENEGKKKPDKSGLCPQCGIVVADVKNHIKAHANAFSCDRCSINFKKEKHLKEHLEVHESENPHKCDLCNLIFKNVTKLALHRYVHTRSYDCPICGFIATSKFRNSIIAHIKRHEDNYAVRCDICNKGFLCKKKLEEHIEWHENVPKYECEICHKKFPVKSYLTLHNKFNHKKELYGTEEIFQCELCGRKFSFEKSFKRHLSCIHKIGKDFTVKCPVCDKLIANNHNLKKHMKVHTGEKNYSCDVCGKTFSQKQYVTRHQRVHEADREGRKRLAAAEPYKIEPLDP